MDKKLTTTQQKTFDSRIVYSDARSDSAITPPTPQPVGTSNIQGTRFASLGVESVWPTTVVAPQPGGAPSSKWTRKTRPWNASLPTTVVASTSNSALSRFLKWTDASDPMRDLTDAEPPAVLPPGSPPERLSPGVTRHVVLIRPVSKTFSGSADRRRTQGDPRELPAAKLPERAAASTAPPSNVR